ncbi:MAG: hypothetical protein ACK5CL_02795 [Sphingomonadales bacterium]
MENIRLFYYLVRLLYNLALGLCVVAGTASLAKRGFIRSLSTLYPYVFIGAFFEFLFQTKTYQLFSFHENIDIVTLVYIYDIIFPMCMVVSVMYRVFGKSAYKIMVFLTFMALLWILLNNFLFVSINYIMSMAAILMLLIWQSKAHSLKWANSIDFLFALNLYFMYINYLQEFKIAVWKYSIINQYQYSIIMFLSISTLILINVKFWRSINH